MPFCASRHRDVVVRGRRPSPNRAETRRAGLGRAAEGREVGPDSGRWRPRRRPNHSLDGKKMPWHLSARRNGLRALCKPSPNSEQGEEGKVDLRCHPRELLLPRGHGYHRMTGDKVLTTGHRALNDCEAVLAVLSRSPIGAPPHLGELLVSARRATVRVFAEGAPFESKDILKARGYRWFEGTPTDPSLGEGIFPRMGSTPSSCL
jgi:hypothetical protein